jgi:hypothetical protein
LTDDILPGFTFERVCKPPSIMTPNSKVLALSAALLTGFSNTPLRADEAAIDPDIAGTAAMENPPGLKEMRHQQWTRIDPE